MRLGTLQNQKSSKLNNRLMCQSYCLIINGRQCRKYRCPKFGHKMKIAWKPNAQPAVVLKEIIKYAVILDKELGRVSYNGLSFLENRPLLMSMLNLNGVESSEHSLTVIFDNAITLTVQGVQKTDADFLKNFNLEYTKYLKEPLIPYVFSTSLSMAPITRFKKYTLNGVELSFYNNDFPVSFRVRKNTYKNYSDNVFCIPDDNVKVLARVSARNKFDAYEQFIEELDFFRAILNLYANPLMTYSLGQLTHVIFNKVSLGKAHCIHRVDGSLADDGLWQQKEYQHQPGYVFSNEFSKDLRKILKVYQSATSAPYDKGKLKDSIIRYVRAFDESDADYSIIKLWSCLESIVGDGNSTLVVKRCAFLFEKSQYEYTKQLLEYIQNYRNRNVHASHSTKSAYQMVFHLGHIFKNLVDFYINNQNFFTDLNEANEFLSFPTTFEMLSRRKMLYGRAIKFRRFD